MQPCRNAKMTICSAPHCTRDVPSKNRCARACPDHESIVLTANQSRFVKCAIDIYHDRERKRCKPVKEGKCSTQLHPPFDADLEKVFILDFHTKTYTYHVRYECECCKVTRPPTCLALLVRIIAVCGFSTFLVKTATPTRTQSASGLSQPTRSPAERVTHCVFVILWNCGDAEERSTRFKATTCASHSNHATAVRFCSRQLAGVVLSVCFYCVLTFVAIEGR